MRYLLSMGIVLSCILLQAQTSEGTILMMNGKVINAHILGQSTMGIRYSLSNKKGVVKEYEEATLDVFSVIDSTGQEKVWYYHDTLFGNDLTVREMRSFIKGEQDARTGYKPFWTTLGGFAFGSATTIIMETEAISLILPPLYGGIMAMPRVHITPGSIQDQTMRGNESYAYGYSQVGKSKRVVRGLLSTFAGVVVGLAVNSARFN